MNRMEISVNECVKIIKKKYDVKHLSNNQIKMLIINSYNDIYDYSDIINKVLFNNRRKNKKDRYERIRNLPFAEMVKEMKNCGWILCDNKAVQIRRIKPLVDEAVQQYENFLKKCNITLNEIISESENSRELKVRKTISCFMTTHNKVYELFELLGLMDFEYNVEDISLALNYFGYEDLFDIIMDGE